MDEVKRLIRAIVISNAGNAMTVAQLGRDFYILEGYNIPYQTYGFKNLQDMLRRMSDAVQVQGCGPTALVSPVTTEKSEHIRKMVVKQKTYSNKVNSPRWPTNGSRCHDSIRNDSGPRSSYKPATFARRNDFTFSSLENSSSSSESCFWQHDNRHLTAQSETSEISAANADQQATKEMDVSCISKEGLHQSHEQQPVDPSMAETKAVSAPAIPLSAMTLADQLPEHQLPPIVKPEAILIALVRTVHSPNKMYVQLECQAKMFVQVAYQLETIYADLDPQSGWHVQEEVAKEGLYCIAKHRDVWYRAMIAGPVVEHRVKVYLIDSAYEVYVGLSDLRHMRKIDATLPLQIMRVSLANVKPSEGEWKAEATRFLGEAMCDKIFHMYVVDINAKDGIPKVGFIDLGNPSGALVFNNELVLNKHAKWDQDDE